MLVEIEKKKYIFNEYVEEKDILSAYDLVMDLLDDSLFEQGDIKELIEVCEFCFIDSYLYSIDYEIRLDYDVEEAHNDWVESNYTHC